MASSTSPLVIFDEFSKLRILDPVQFETSEKLKEECKDFTQRVSNFNEIVEMFLKMMEEKAEQIESEKLKAIGLRNRAEQQMENRKGTQKQLQSLIKERQAELDRLTVQVDSLVKVQHEQEALIDSLSSK
ncbi:uncharacterized protein SPPG_05368 [Spizellomyces punctatus DAOM BR117]|uniref:Intraflagellar transport protein 20 n=1 Tax=Spizellomyces punctatus (strain DAOM BR117) TaxID=645134 RepID=A0A0L0HEE7_SPIPD|nr:uncharacterized protein SPPG_05368 [Spizellomyces punctatus DAOM BR117]KNC99108.1 hypothetical protein SPPG_05368 [Spizellomyces punctatus DAOM BR117]|eukprot:XP_016607148.1 hypothetical protein SPPG_05368 [Spizellomyces punctatus DAOM BR117]